MSANLSSMKSVRFQDSGTGQDGSPISISVAAIAAQGCTVRAIAVETQITSGGAANLAIFGGPTGATATLLVGATTVVVAATGGDVAPLTATVANLQLESTDIITLQRGGADSQNAVTIYFGDYTPTTITVT